MASGSACVMFCVYANHQPMETPTDCRYQRWIQNQETIRVTTTLKTQSRNRWPKISRATPKKHTHTHSLVLSWGWTYESIWRWLWNTWMRLFRTSFRPFWWRNHPVSSWSRLPSRSSGITVRSKSMFSFSTFPWPTMDGNKCTGGNLPTEFSGSSQLEQVAYNHPIGGIYNLYMRYKGSLGLGVTC